MAKVPAFAKVFAGRWRIVEMDVWDNDVLDIGEEPHLTFKGASDGEIEAAIALVRSCQPRPGANVFTAPPEYVIPDVFVRRHEGQWVVELNNSMSPQLRVNQLYAGSLGRGEEYDALKAQLQEARWLIRSLEIRNETLLKVALTIVQRQTEFLEQGEEYMRPMVLRDVAETIEMHESTLADYAYPHGRIWSGAEALVD